MFEKPMCPPRLNRTSTTSPVVRKPCVWVVASRQSSLRGAKSHRISQLSIYTTFRIVLYNQHVRARHTPRSAPAQTAHLKIDGQVRARASSFLSGCSGGFPAQAAFLGHFECELPHFLDAMRPSCHLIYVSGCCSRVQRCQMRRGGDAIFWLAECLGAESGPKMRKRTGRVP